MNRLEATMAQHWINNAQPGAANCANCSDSCRLRRAKARTQNIAPVSLEGVSCGCKIMTPRYAVWQNAQQLPLFLQGERPQRKPWLFWLASGWLGLASGWLGLASGWLSSWLSGWLAWLLAGFLAGLAWLLAGFLAGLVWLLAGLVWLLAGFLAGLAWLSFFPCCLARLQKRSCWAFCKLSRGHYFAATRSVLDFEFFAGRGQMLDGRVPGASQVEQIHLGSQERGGLIGPMASGSKPPIFGFPFRPKGRPSKGVQCVIPALDVSCAGLLRRWIGGC